MAGLIYLPSILAHHSSVAVDSEAAQSFTDIERRLLRALINPAMALAFITGIALIIGTGAGAPGTGYWMHGIMSASRKRLERRLFSSSGRSTCCLISCHRSTGFGEAVLAESVLLVCLIHNTY